VILEISIPGQDGFQILQEIHRRHPSTRVLIMSLYADPQCARRARQLRASGYFRKNASRADILKAFQTVLAGGHHFEDCEDSLPFAADAQPAPRHASLSSREHAVMLTFVAGKRVGEIASELNLSAKTVSTYKRRRAGFTFYGRAGPLRYRQAPVVTVRLSLRYAAVHITACTGAFQLLTPYDLHEIPTPCLSEPRIGTRSRRRKTPTTQNEFAPTFQITIRSTSLGRLQLRRRLHSIKGLNNHRHDDRRGQTWV